MGGCDGRAFGRMVVCWLRQPGKVGWWLRTMLIRVGWFESGLEARSVGSELTAHIQLTGDAACVRAKTTKNAELRAWSRVAGEWIKGEELFMV